MKQNVRLVNSDYPCMGEKFPGIDYPKNRCMPRCTYCALQGYDTKQNTIAEGFENVVRAMANYDGAYISPYTDSFNPDNRRMTHSLLEDFFSKGKIVLINTKQVIPNKTIDLIAEYRKQAIVQISLPSLDEKLISIYEPGSASVEDRLDVMKSLTNKNVPVIALVMPWLNSEHENIDALPEKLSEIGVERVIASVGTFTDKTIKRIKAKKYEPLADAVEQMTKENKILIGEGRTIDKKIEAYERLGHAFENYGIKFKVCGTALNPDLIEKEEELPFKLCTKLKHRWLK